MTPLNLYERALARQQRLRRQKASRRMEENIVRITFAEPEQHDPEPSPKITTEEEYFAWLHRNDSKPKRVRRRAHPEWEFVEPDFNWDGFSF